MDQTTRQDDYDSPWKQAIEAMFPEFMGFYFPHASAAIDWRQPHRFLEQELRKISPGAAGGHRVVDKLAGRKEEGFQCSVFGVRKKRPPDIDPRDPRPVF